MALPSRRPTSEAHPVHDAEYDAAPTTGHDAAHALPTFMRALTRRAWGGVEQLRVETLPRPEPGRGEVLVAVRAAGLDRGALHLLTGTPYAARLAFGLRRPRHPGLGLEVAGTVAALGPGTTTGLRVGDRVFGTAQGAFAQFAVARADRLAATPPNVTDEQAATLSVSGGTALEAVERYARVASGTRVLVLGASGGVGTFAVQIAVDLGAEVTAVCSAAKADLVRGLGAAHVADYRTTRVSELDGPFDAVIDIAGNRSLRELRGVLTPTGTLAIVGGEGGGAWLGGLERNLAALALGPFTRQRLASVVTRQSSELHAGVGRLVARGAVHPVVDRVVDLDGVAPALTAMERGTLRGKVVVRP